VRFEMAAEKSRKRRSPKRKTPKARALPPEDSPFAKLKELSLGS